MNVVILLAFDETQRRCVDAPAKHADEAQSDAQRAYRIKPQRMAMVAVLEWEWKTLRASILTHKNYFRFKPKKKSGILSCSFL